MQRRVPIKQDGLEHSKWKDRLKKRCGERMRKNRRELLFKLRHTSTIKETIQEIIHVESNDTSASSDDFINTLSKEDYEEVLQWLEHELELDMQLFEEESQMQELLQFEEEWIASAVKNLFIGSMSEDDTSDANTCEGGK